MLPFLVPVLYYLFGDKVEDRSRSIFEYILEFSDDFLNLLESFFAPFFSLILNFLTWAYEFFIVSFLDFIFSLIEHSKDSFVYNGHILIEKVFDQFSLDSTFFIDNFIFFFLGLLLFSLSAKFLFKMVFNLLGFFFDLILKL